MDDGQLKTIMGICIALRKRADFFLNNEPENLSNMDFDEIAEELEKLAQQVDDLIGSSVAEKDT